MFHEDDLLPLSGLQHLLYCERRAYLVHAEMAWRENAATAEGRGVHDRAHAGGAETRGDVRTARSLRLRALTLGLVGVADIVEFRRLSDGNAGGCVLSGAAGRWQLSVEEHAHG